nr:glucan endo-1,3-beta-glucosidase-like [Tanacetum cinerariifolium]
MAGRERTRKNKTHTKEIWHRDWRHTLGGSSKHVVCVVLGCGGERLLYGLPSEQDVVNLYRRNGITRMRIYDPNQATLRALGGTNIELILDVPNDRLQELADPNGTARWVQNNIRNYPNVRFRYISVGNEVDPDTDSRRFLSFVLPAMRNVQKAISDAGLQIKGATMENAGTYYRNLIAYVKSTRGTPLRPGRTIETYLFAMFDENLKGGKETEKHFGVFLPNQSSKYNLRF